MAATDQTQSLEYYATAILRRRWPYLVTILPGVFLLAAYLAFALPAKYNSTAIVLLEPSSIPPELVQTTVIGYATQRIEIVQRTVMTPDRLIEVVEKIDPYPGTGMSPERKAFTIIENTTLEKVDPITLEPAPESSAFSISYLNPDPEIAAAVAHEMANLFLEYNRKTRVEAAIQAQGFLEQRSIQVEEQIRGFDQKLAEFKRQYGDALPESQVRNEAALDRTQRDMDALQAQIRLAEQQEAMLRLQLSQISPSIVSSATDAYTELGRLRAELALAQQRYTEDHPDVRRLRRAISELAAAANLGPNANVRPDNPEYLRVSSELDAARRNLVALRSTANRAQSQLADYERRLVLAPNVERDYAQLVRSREVARAQFEEIQGKLNDAVVATNLESEAKGERFTLIGVPSAASSPSEPNRFGLILLGLVLGGVLAVGTAVFKENYDPTVRSIADVRAVGNLDVIGAIPNLATPQDRRRRNLVWGSVAAAYGLAVVAVMLTAFF